MAGLSERSDKSPAPLGVLALNDPIDMSPEHLISTPSPAARAPLLEVKEPAEEPGVSSALVPRGAPRELSRDPFDVELPKTERVLFSTDGVYKVTEDEGAEALDPREQLDHSPSKAPLLCRWL